MRRPLVLLVALAVTAGLAGCYQHSGPVHRGPDSTEGQPAHISYNVRVRFTDSIRTKAILQSAVARLWEDRQETTLGDTVIVDFFSATSGRRMARLTADSAIIDDRTKNMVAIGNVVVWSDSSRTSLSTTRLVWDNSRERFSTTEYVRIVSPKETIEGEGFESDQYLTSYRIFKFRVRGEQR